MKEKIIRQEGKKQIIEGKQLNWWQEVAKVDTSSVKIRQSMVRIYVLERLNSPHRRTTYVYCVD